MTEDRLLRGRDRLAVGFDDAHQAEIEHPGSACAAVAGRGWWSQERAATEAHRVYVRTAIRAARVAMRSAVSSRTIPAERVHLRVEHGVHGDELRSHHIPVDVLRRRGREVVRKATSGPISLKDLDDQARVLLPEAGYAELGGLRALGGCHRHYLS